MARPIPFRWITGLDPQAQKEIERNFLELQTQITASPDQNHFYVACVDALASEKDGANIQLTGANDAAVLNAHFIANPGATYYFSSGTVQLELTLAVTEGIKLYGTTITSGGSPFYAITTLNGSGAAANFLLGAANACLIDTSIAAHCVIEGFKLTHTWSGGTNDTAFITGSVSSIYQRYAWLEFGSWSYWFRVNAGHPLTSSLLEHFTGVAPTTATWIFPGFGSFSACVVYDMITGITPEQTNMGGCLLLFAVPAGTAEINGNFVLPKTTYPPGGSAGGELSGTYPNPLLNPKNMLMGELAAIQSGVQTIPVPAPGSAPTGPAGGSLNGTYPNPTFLGRDASVDALNKDMLPAEMSAPFGVQNIPVVGGAPSGAAGGSLGGTYPNPTFAGRDSSGDKINQDMLPSELSAPQVGVIVIPTPAAAAAATPVDFNQAFMLMGG